jgi:WD40 repeat protein
VNESEIFKLDLGTGQIEKIVKSPQRASFLSCHDFDPNIFISERDDQLSMFDCRDPKISSRSSRTGLHINNISWSPFVPYWMAATTRDSVLVYDLRFGFDSPMRHFPSYSTSCVSFSNSNSDLLCSTDSNKSVSLWCLGNGSSQPVDSILNRAPGGPITNCTVPLLQSH